MCFPFERSKSNYIVYYCFNIELVIEFVAIEQAPDFQSRKPKDNNTKLRVFVDFNYLTIISIIITIYRN